MAHSEKKQPFSKDHPAVGLWNLATSRTTALQPLAHPRIKFM